MNDDCKPSAPRRTQHVGIDPVQRLLSTLRSTVTTIALALLAGCAPLAPSEVMKPTAVAPAEKPFATVLALESVQLEEPMLFPQAGQMVPVRDIVVVYLTPAQVV